MNSHERGNAIDLVMPNRHFFILPTSPGKCEVIHGTEHEVLTLGEGSRISVGSNDEISRLFDLSRCIDKR